MYKLEVKIDRALARMNRLPGFILKPLGAEARVLARALRDSARAKATGGVLNVRTGKFRRSIRASTRMNRFGVTGKVTSSAPQAQLFEWGGTIPPHVIEPKNKKALAFIGTGGNPLVLARVDHPGAKFTPHSVIHAAFDEMQEDIRQGLNDALVDAIRSEQDAP